MIDGPDTAAWVEAWNDKPGDQTAWYFANDFKEESKLQQFYPQNGSKWFENLAMYGVTRAIDSHFGPVGQNKSDQGASYAGQNGRTYPAGQAMGGGDGTLMLLLLVGAVALVAMND